MPFSWTDYPFDMDEMLQKRRSLLRQLRQQPDLPEKKIAILSGVTVGVLKDYIEIWLLASGIRPVFWEGSYALYWEQLVYDTGELKAFSPDVIYIHTSMRCIRHWPQVTVQEDAVQESFQQELQHFTKAAEAALGLGCPVILNNFELPVYRPMGNSEAVFSAGRVRFVRRLNEALAQLAENTPNLYLHDLAYLQARYGMDAFSDLTAWYAYKYPCAMNMLPCFAQSVAHIIKSLFGKNKKAIALDLDNTLWGGVIGDDGPEGIVIGNETPTGMAYTEFQSYLKQLQQQGVLLNVNSKNQEEIAVKGFERPESILKKEDFISFKANWQPKSRNLQQMAEEINIFPDAFVFADDKPAERDIIRQQVPGAAVPELTEPESYIRAIDRGGYFEVTGFSADDRSRNEMYRQNAQRQAAEQMFADYGSYLQSLQMTGQFGAFDTAHAERITQLINKSNQFNLTTRRYTQTQVEGLIDDSGFLTMYGKLVDRFGDNGLVSVMIGSIDGEILDLQLWVMSCRILKRDMEKAMLDCFVQDAVALGIRQMRAHYYPTVKNAPVNRLCDSLGFSLVSEDTAGNREYLLELVDYQPRCDVIDKIRI